MKKNGKYILSLVFLVVSQLVLAQVGIGTTTPDPSSILDMTSTTQGVLTPRMTSVQRNAIASPVDGLLVFDTTLDAFYYFSGSSWVKLEGSVKRDNYKLVKSVADLADELAAGGGSSYQLQTNFLYEINGTISINFPIDLNGAYIEGVDVNEDRLLNASGSALFSGSKGGSLRNLTILGNGSPVFNITGSTLAENVAASTVIFVGASSIGTLSNLGLVYFNVSQFVSNLEGLSASNITTLFMPNVFWTESNTGTFLTLSGSFDNLQLANGRVVADSGEAGLDVSANPTIGVSASLVGINFTGDGERVKGYTAGGYTGYNFTKNWDVNSPGITEETDNTAIGNFNLSAAIGSGVATSFSGTGTSSRVKLSGITTSNNLFRFTASGNNRIVYDGIKTRNFQITTTISFQGDNNNSIFIFYIAKGTSGSSTASVIENTRVYREVGENNDVGPAAIVGALELAPGDFVEVWAERFSGGGDLLTVSLNLVAK
tara:strand:- start:33886 stop:35346 length:1461 start_codon:yes stop_codon:yes gene_type:complete